MCWRSLSLALVVLLMVPITVPPARGQQRDKPDAKRLGHRQEQAENRTESLQAICKRIDVGAGSVIADIGAGRGRDTWVFADIVGETGKVFAEEIEKSKTETVKKEAEKRSLEQVQTVLGTTTSPKLPDNTVDMAFMHYVYHHITKPREMLRNIWKSLKPGGHLVIVDRELGTLTNWVPREKRGGKHYWIGETTVVREARETGFSFVECADPLWHKKDTFVLILQRPMSLPAPNRDPDPLPEIPDSTLSQLLPPEKENYQRVAFVALGQGRELIRPLLKATSREAVDIVLEEWATRKDERPPLPQGIKLPSAFTEQGDPNLSSKPIDAVYFLDTYHLLFHGPVLLEHLRERLTDDGKIYILDRAADQKMSHRESSHRRMIPPELVKQEMQQARFVLSREVAHLGPDRFLMVFEKSE